MAEKLNIERYKLSHGKQHCDIFLDGLDIATVYEEEYLHLLAAAPLMLEALKDAQEFIYENTPHEYGISEEYTKITKRIAAAIAAAKGE
jgi:hypothetical protein